MYVVVTCQQAKSLKVTTRTSIGFETWDEAVVHAKAVYTGNLVPVTDDIVATVEARRLRGSEYSSGVFFTGDHVSTGRGSNRLAAIFNTNPED